MTKARKITELHFKGYTRNEIFQMGITPNRRYLDSILSKYRSNVKYKHISKRSLSVIVGTLLGDSHINKRKYTPVFSFRHKKEHLEYLQHKVKIIDLSCKISNTDQYRNETLCEGFTAVFHAHPIFKKLRNVFYPKGTKKFPLEYCKKYLDWEGLCIWFLDDGTSSSHSCNIAIFNFKKDAELIQQFLIDKFNLKTNIQNNGNQLYIPVNQRNYFFDNIEPYIPNCMRYKIKKSL